MTSICSPTGSCIFGQMTFVFGGEANGVNQFVYVRNAVSANDSIELNVDRGIGRGRSLSLLCDIIGIRRPDTVSNFIRVQTSLS